MWVFYWCIYTELIWWQLTLWEDTHEKSGSTSDQQETVPVSLFWCTVPNFLSYDNNNKYISVLAATTQLAEQDLKLITTSLREVSKWHQLGIQLGLSPGLLHTIESNHPRDADRCKTEVLTWWLQNAEQRSWDKIAEALDKIEYKVLAVKLKRKSFQGQFVSLGYVSVEVKENIFNE